MGTINLITKVACTIGLLVGTVGFITCLITEDMFGALTWGVVALLNQNALNADN